MDGPDRSDSEGVKVSSTRFVLLVSHTRREEAMTATRVAVEKLVAAGITPVMTEIELNDFASHAAGLESHVKQLDKDCKLDQLELAMVLGGDGTILKAAEVVRESSVPLVGINLGHVGFLAESESEDLAEVVSRVAAKQYKIRERLTLDVTVFVDGKEVYKSWALNEATVEKSERERMLEVVVEVEGHPLSSFGCDGIVISTPTGSTAYAFSAGGPIVWPTVDALMLVPLSAHALFARPLVIRPDAVLAVEVLQRSAGHGILWCDGRRSVELPPGARVEVRKSGQPVRIARMHEGKFTDRLVKKFQLPVTGWRGTDHRK
jgi:NAD+ kinase